jgi:hypothetical protein
VQLEKARLGSSADQTTGKQPEPTRASGVRGRGADHHGADYVEEGDHGFEITVWRGVRGGKRESGKAGKRESGKAGKRESGKA